jgi:hypothetical protein
VRGLLVGAFAYLALTAQADAATRGRPVIAVAASSGIVLVDLQRGERTAVPGTVRGDGAPALAPDGRRLAFSSARSGNAELYVIDLWTEVLARLTVNRRAADTAPSWSPDGGSLAWSSGRPGAHDVYVMRSDGTRKRRLAGGSGDQREPDWAPDGSRLVFSSNALGDADLWTVPSAGGAAALLADLPGDELRPAWAPGGKLVAFAHAAGRRTVVETISVAGGESRRVAASRSETGSPAWSPTGMRLTVVSAQGGTGAVRVIVTAGGSPKALSGLGGGDREPDWGLLTAPEGPAARAGERLPDLDQRAPRGLVIIRSSGRTLLGFASAVDNVGTGPLRVRGIRRTAAAMRAHQIVELAGGGTRAYLDVGRLRYTPHPPHYHWHFSTFERFELRRADDYSLVGRDRKTGFCLADHYGHAARRVRAFGPPRFLGDCGKGRPDLRRVEQGSTPGYTDRYRAFFHGQNVDITGVPAGLYVLVHRANPDLLTHELRYDNNAASVLIRLARPPGRLPSVRVLAVCEGRERCGLAPTI